MTGPAGRMFPGNAAPFLSPFAAGAQAPHLLRNLRNGKVVASRLETAFDRARRKTGLLGRSSMDAGGALILAPCRAVHTCFMRFTIDVAFVSRAGRVTKIYRSLPAWRWAGSLGAYGVVELAGGALALSDTQAGDSLVAEPMPAEDRASTGSPASRSANSHGGAVTGRG